MMLKKDMLKKLKMPEKKEAESSDQEMELELDLGEGMEEPKEKMGLDMESEESLPMLSEDGEEEEMASPSPLAEISDEELLAEIEKRGLK